MNGILFYLALLISCTAAGLLQTFCGFGAGVVILLFVSQFMEITVAATVNLSVCSFLSLYLLVRFFKKVEFKKTLVPLVCYVVVSLFLNSYILRLSGHKNLLGILFGVFQIVLSVYYLFLTKAISSKGSLTSGIVCGSASGITAALFGVGGPFLSVHMLPASGSMESYTANMQVIFTVTNIFLVVDKARQGLYSASLIPMTAVGGAGVVLGGTLGVILLKKIKPDAVKKTVYIFLGISGIITVLQYAL